LDYVIDYCKGISNLKKQTSSFLAAMNQKMEALFFEERVLKYLAAMKIHL